MILGAVIDRTGPDERDALVAAGCTAVRVPARWRELQPGADRWDGDAVEALRTAVTDVAAAGLAPWVALLGRQIPPWFDDEGGFADTRTAGRWWPRYVDGMADRVGDVVAGWFPMVNPAGFAAAAFADRDPDVARAGRRNLIVAWRDAWRILRGPAPVATALVVSPWSDEWPRALRTGEPTPTGLELEDLAGSCDRLGGIVVVTPTTGADQPAELLVRLAAEGPERPVTVLAALEGPGDEERARAAEVAVEAVRLVGADGVDVHELFADSWLSDDGAPSSAAGVLAQLRPR